MKKFRLQVILDRGLINSDIIEAARKIISGGAGLIQLRDKVSSDNALLKDATKLAVLAKKNCVSLIINDRVDIAMASGADGVHLGGDDLPYSEARKILGKDRVIGITTRCLKEALAAERMGADYIGIGPVFSTTTKPALNPIGPDIAGEVATKINIPAFFIGGITSENIEILIRKGARHIAIAGAILKSADITETTKSFVEILNKKMVQVR